MTERFFSKDGWYRNSMRILNTIRQYENRNGDKISHSNTKFTDKILFKFAVKTMLGTDNIPLYLMTQNVTFAR